MILNFLIKLFSDHARFNNISKILSDAKAVKTSNDISEKLEIPPQQYQDTAVPQDIVLESKISELKEVFPDLGEGKMFI